MAPEEALALAQATMRATLAETYRHPTAEERLSAYRRAYPERQAMLSPDGKSIRFVFTPDAYPAVMGEAIR